MAGEHADVVERLAAKVLAWQKSLPESPLRAGGGMRTPPAKGKQVPAAKTKEMGSD